MFLHRLACKWNKHLSLCDSLDIKLIFFWNKIDFIHNFCEFSLFSFSLLQYLTPDISRCVYNNSCISQPTQNDQLNIQLGFCLLKRFTFTTSFQVHSWKGHNHTAIQFPLGTHDFAEAHIFIPQSTIMEFPMRPLGCIQTTSSVHANLLRSSRPAHAWSLQDHFYIVMDCYWAYLALWCWGQIASVQDGQWFTFNVY